MRSFDSIPEQQWTQVSQRSGSKWQLPVRLDVQCPKASCGCDLVHAQISWQEAEMLATGKVNCGKCSSTVYFAALFTSKGKPESPARPTTIIQWPESPSTAFPEAAKISPRFETAHAEAERAHRLGLVELAGMGYRRALEMLVKDYAISIAPDDQAKIEKEALDKCISNRIENMTLREAARRVAWLGNDWAHYRRRWEDQDVATMKGMLRIVAHLLADRAELDSIIRQMPSPENPKPK